MEALGECRLPKRLLAAPPSLPRESRISWVQRLCGAHQYSEGRLSDISGIRPVAKDWDRGVTQTEWASLLNLAGVPVDSCGEASYGLGLLCRSFPGHLLLLHEKKMPRYRWCSICLASDPVPYLRWDWRLMGMEHCSVHHVPLDDQCGWCGSSLHVHRALLVSAGYKDGTSDLATCASCGMSLFDRGGIACHAQRTDGFLEDSMAIMDDLLALLKQGCQLNDRQLTLDFSRYAAFVGLKWQPKPCGLQTTDGQQVRASVDAHTGRLSHPNNWPLHINGGVFREAKPSIPKTKVDSRNLGDLLQARRRLRLAHALHVIRAEKNAQRRQREAEAEHSEVGGIL